MSGENETTENSTETVPKMGLAGFVNIGNTCYMNSGLQLLLHCLPLIDFLIEDEEGNATYQNYLHRSGLRQIGNKIRKENKIPDSQEVMVKKSQLEEFKENSFTKKLADIVKIIMKKGNSLITPREFKEILGDKYEEFQGRRQHDAHEFLINVIDTLYEETAVEAEPVMNNIPETITQYIELLTQTKNALKGASDLEERKLILENLSAFKRENSATINRYDGLNYIIREYKKNYSPLISQLRVFLVHNYKCKNCGYETSRHAVDTVLSVDLTPSLPQSLNKMCTDEEISFTCSGCNLAGKAITNCRIYKTPLVLFIHLKRFEQLQNGRTRKDESFVNIPKLLDLNPYCDEGMMAENNLSNVYELKGICNHHGGLNHGHYTANCTGIIDPENWYEFDDSCVSKWDGDKIDIASTYMAMYQMVKPNKTK